MYAADVMKFRVQSRIFCCNNATIQAPTSRETEYVGGSLTSSPIPFRLVGFR